MKQVLLLILTVTLFSISYAQSKDQKKLEKWLKSQDVECNKPITPTGFERRTDCKNKPIYRKQIGDTIILYTWGGFSAENLEEFKKSTKENGYNTFHYPTAVQSNATIIVDKMVKRTFIWRNDTLSLLDDFNEEAAKAHLRIMEDYFAKKITPKEYKQKLKEFDKSQYPYSPKFKTIYFKGIFENNNAYLFKHHQNFRNEKVNLINKWSENGKIHYEINLQTHTNGRYRFSEDMMELETNNCLTK